MLRVVVLLTRPISKARVSMKSPAFADADFNLASTLEALKESKTARAHWQIHLELEPKGDWAEIARRFLRSR